LIRDTEQLVTSNTPIDDAALVLANKAGDIAPFEELVTRYDRKLLRIAKKLFTTSMTHNAWSKQPFSKLFVAESDSADLFVHYLRATQT
jgi:hypothetical protein